MPNSQPNIHDADEARYDTLISIVDSIKNDADLDSDVYATAIQNLYWPEINVLRQNQATQVRAELDLARRDLEVSVCYSPGAIRDSFDGADEDHPDAQWVEQASDEQLLEVSYMIVGSDPVWKDFHENIEMCIEEMRMRNEKTE